MTDSGLFSRAVHGARWLVISKIVSQAFMWVATIYVMRILDPADYGVMAMGGMLTILAGMLLDAGLGAALVQRRDVPEDVYPSANAALILGAIFALLVVQLLAGVAADFFDQPLLELVLRVASLQFIFGALAVVPGAKLTKQMRFKEIGVGLAVAGLGSSAVTLLLAMAGVGVWSLVIGVISASVIRFVTFSWAVGELPKFSRRLSLLRSFIPFSSHLLAQRIAWFWVEQADQLIIGRVLGAAPLGAYSVARNLSHIPLDRAAEIVNQVSLPTFSAVQRDRSRWNPALERLVRLVSGVTFPLFWGMAAVAPVAIPLVLGEKWQSAVVPFVLFCLILPMRSAHSLTGTVLLSLGRADLSFRSVLLWAVVLTPLFYLGAKFGLTGVAAAWAVGFPVVYVLSAKMCSKALNISIWIFLRPMVLPGVAASACVVVVLAIDLVRGSTLSPLTTLILQVLAGALVYISTLRLIAPAAFEEGRSLLMSVLGIRTAVLDVDR